MKLHLQKKGNSSETMSWPGRPGPSLKSFLRPDLFHPPALPATASLFSPIKSNPRPAHLEGTYHKLSHKGSMLKCLALASALLLMLGWYGS